MKLLACILLSVLATLMGVEGQENCTYEECSQLLNNLKTLTPLSVEYCIAHNQTFACVEAELNQCIGINSAIAYGIIIEWNSLPMCPTVTPTSTITPTVTVTPSSDVCSFTECNNLFHALNPNDTSYCYQRVEVYNCLDRILNGCPDASILNHDITKEALDNLPSSSCECVRCNDIYDALAARTPTDDDYCELHKQVDECTGRIFALCNNNETLFWHAVTISNLLGQLPVCNTTQPPPAPCASHPVCLNGVYNCNPVMELNDNLPNFTDRSTNCDVTSEQNFYYCGVYSYSHLRAFNSDYVHTCSSPGLWALFSHPSLKITVQNSVPNLSGPYTVVDELNVVISASNCSQEMIYHASATEYYLPATFEDGTYGINGLELILNSNGTSAYIRIPWINTIIVVHKLANHIGIAIQSPESVANKSIGLCSLGCPEHSKLTVQEVVNHDLSGNCSKEAYLTCSLNDFALLNIKIQGDNYFEKCLFDTLTTNNSNSSWISLAMVNNWHMFKNSNIDSSTISTPSPEYENQQFTENDSSAHGSTLCITMVAWCLSLYAIMLSS